MKLLLRKITACLLCLALFTPTPAGAVAYAPWHTARQLNAYKCVTNVKGISQFSLLFDGKTHYTTWLESGASITMEHPDGIGSLYLIFHQQYWGYTVTDNSTGNSVRLGTEGFLHEYADLKEAFGYCPEDLTITFDSGRVGLSELTIFGEGKMPRYVQKWRQPKDGETDIVLFSTHGDDEHLFFAGLLPTYAAERKCQVQLVYFTDHHNLGAERMHEILDGLWAVGIKSYPVFGPFGDYYSETADDARAYLNLTGFSDEEMEAFVVEALRRFKPKVVVGHDPIHGEYGHGQHMLYADLLCYGVENAADPEVFPELAEKWGTWDTPKTYLHLWPENPIVLDYDQPLRSFYGMTAYEVSRDLGFAAHASQVPDYTWYFHGFEKAADLTRYSCCEFGLYRTTVGLDSGIGDLMENVTPYEK